MKDPELIEKLIPEYDMGCKRITPSFNYLQTFNRDNVKLVTDPIKGLLFYVYLTPLVSGFLIIVEIFHVTSHDAQVFHATKGPPNEGLVLDICELIGTMYLTYCRTLLVALVDKTKT